MEIGIKKLTETAQVPTKANNTDAGYDLYADEEVTITSMSRALISTGITIVQPPSRDKELIMYGQILPRSGLAHKHGIDVFGGVIDNGYTGEVKVILFNSGMNDYKVEKGTKIAQIVFFPIWNADLVDQEEIVKTDRGDKGFGSSG